MSTMTDKLYARYTYACNRIGIPPHAVHVFETTAELINTITTLENDPRYINPPQPEPQPQSNARYGRIIGQLDKSMRAKLRKMTDARPLDSWVGMVLPIEILLRAGVQFRAL